MKHAVCGCDIGRETESILGREAESILGREAESILVEKPSRYWSRSRVDIGRVCGCLRGAYAIRPYEALSVLSLMANWPHAASISFPRLRRTLVITPWLRR